MGDAGPSQAKKTFTGRLLQHIFPPPSSPHANRVQEQHAKEWDSIELPDPLGAERFTSEKFGTTEKSKIAGRYGSWTNVFIIGRTVS